MKFHWTMAAVLSSAVLVGCGDRAAETSNIPEENNVAATEGTTAAVPPAAPATSAPVDDAARRRNAVAPKPSDSATRPQPSSSAPPANLAPAPEARLPVWRDVTIEPGTALPLELMTPLSSETAQVETPVRARLRQDVIVDDYTAIPSGAILTGTVTAVERPGRVQGRAHPAFRFNEVEVNGGREDLRTNPITFEGEATKGEDATKIGVGAGVGAAIGGILGGKKGAAKGGAIGAGAGTGAVLATRGKDVEIAGGTDITATLAQPSTIRVQAR